MYRFPTTFTPPSSCRMNDPLTVVPLQVQTSNSGCQQGSGFCPRLLRLPKRDFPPPVLVRSFRVALRVLYCRFTTSKRKDPPSCGTRVQSG